MSTDTPDEQRGLVEPDPIPTKETQMSTFTDRRHYWCDTCNAGAEGCEHSIRPVRYEKRDDGQWMRLSPCTKPDHLEKFEWGYLVLSCKNCSMELVTDVF